MHKFTMSMNPLFPIFNWKIICHDNANVSQIESIIKKYGTDVLYQFDEKGLYPIHWAAVCGKSEILELIIRYGISPAIKAQCPDVPEPIHIAAMEGNISAIDTLIRHGVDVNVIDGSGCTPLMRAAMYGYSAEAKSSETVLHLLSRGAEPSISDIYGFNCLHYAVLKSNEETVRLLLTIGLDPNHKDKRGMRPFEIALKIGNKSIIELLGPLTDGIDRNSLNEMIRKYRKKRPQEAIDGVLIVLSQLIVLSSVLFIIFWEYPQFIFYYYGENTDMKLFFICFVIINIITWTSFGKTYRSDPGYFPINTKEYQFILSQKLSLAGQRQFWLATDIYKNVRLCHTCKTVQSLRAKHCRFCKRCTARFDHHCLYLGTCVGENNRISFFVLTLSMFISGLLGYMIISRTVKHEGTLHINYHVLNMSYCIKMSIVGAILTLCTLRRAAINLTQNEEIRKCRYKYLWTNDGKFQNPFDKGSYINNIIEYFRIKPNYRKKFQY